MKTFGAAKRRNAQCQCCQSLERHRLLWLYLKNKTDFFETPLKVLHFAPESCFRERFKNLANLDYVFADLSQKQAMLKIDITEIGLSDDTFDVILCSHVLEHVQDDLEAMKELFRVLKPGGWAIFMVPVKGEENFEVEYATTSAERKKLFGQHDHVRWYGCIGFQQRLASVGFAVTEDDYNQSLGKENIIRMCLLENEKIYFCEKK